MLFNSLSFALFLPTVFAVHWWVARGRRGQNLLLLAASYIFYGWWDWRFLSLIVFSTLVDFFAGRAMAGATSPTRRRRLLGLSLATNLGLLGFFKYFNFFVGSAVEAAAAVGVELQSTTLDIILPVGISFYTFQTLSYTIDIYRGKLDPTDDFLDFATFVAFFPQLVAGPIERASALVPQFHTVRRFDQTLATSGMRLMLWGFMKKVIVADGVAPHVDQIFGAYDQHDAPTLVIGAFLFATQIYCDFSGYSDIAIGCARLFGIQLSTNFRMPYLAVSLQDFWQRWHISLSSWFRDYVYIPLGGSRGSRAMKLRNLAIVFLVSGLWHGAAWTFILWGALHALYYVPETLIDRRPKSRLGKFVGWGFTMALVLFAWVFFRAPSATDAFGYLYRVFTTLPGETPSGNYLHPLRLSLALYLVEFLRRDAEHPLEIANLSPTLRWATYYACVAALLGLGTYTDTPFIYFQF